MPGPQREESVDRDGQQTKVFEDAGDFGDGRAPATADGELWGYIDPTGAWSLQPKWLNAESFSEACAVVQVSDGCSVIEPSGARCFPDAHPMIQGCYGGRIACMANGRVGYRDRSGRWVIPPRFEEAGNFHEGFAVVWFDERRAVIDRAGHIVWPEYSASF